MEKEVNTENCMICGILLEETRNKLTVKMNFSQKAIYSMIEEFTETSFSEDIIKDAAVCDNCLQKFGEYDEYSHISMQIKEEISSLFFSTLNQVKGDDPLDMPLKIETVDQDDVLVYETVDGLHSEMGDDDEEMILAQEVSDLPEDVMDLVEVAEIDKKNLPRKFQTIQRGEKQKVVKTRSNVSEKDSFTIVQLDDNIRLYQCDICSRTFKEKSKLKSHKEIHTTERKIFCPTCGKAFKTAACLRSHKRVHNPTIIECDFCGKSYTQKPELIKHIQFVHFNRRDFVCQICGASFGCRGHLKAHCVTHQPLKGMRCEVCSFSFHTKAKLDRHMKSHTGERDYECGLCGKRFLYSYNVSAHIRHVHWKEKRKPEERIKTCTICEQKFSSNFKLREHLENVHQYQEVDGSVIIEEDPNFVEYEEEEVFALVET